MKENAARVFKKSSAGRAANKFCKVCGDKAIGCNFSVITCESCKAFFRRNALNIDSVLRCPYSNSCEVTQTTRKDCQQCRLAKCFVVGMNTASILRDKALIYKRSQYNRRRRSVTSGSSWSPSADDGSGSSLSSSFRHQCPTCKCGQPVFPFIGPQGEAVIGPATIERYYEIMTRNSEVETPAPEHAIVVELANENDTLVMNELIWAGDVIINDKGPIANGELTDVYRDPEAGILAGMDKAMRLYIHTFRLMTTFCNLSRNDQTALLKSGYIQLIATRTAWAYNFSDHVWRPLDSMPDFVFRPDDMAKMSPAMYNMNMKFVRSLNPVWLNDHYIMLLMSTCVLFNLKRDGLEDANAVGKAFEMYLSEKTYPSDAQSANYAYYALIAKIEELDVLSKSLDGLFKPDVVDKLGPLIKELSL